MVLSYESALRLFQSGEYGVLAKAAPTSRTAADLAPPTRVLLAHALARVGRPGEVLALVGDVGRAADPGLQSGAHIALGLADCSLGNLNSGAVHLRSAVRLAQEDGSGEGIAWARLHLLRHAADVGDLDLGQAMLPSVRSAVHVEGSPALTAYLHVTTASLEGQAGRPEEARRHCDVAMRLLDTTPHAWLQCVTHHVQAAVAVSQFRLDEAMAHLQQLGVLAEQHGLAGPGIHSEVNVGLISHLRGDFARSEHALRRVLESEQSSTLAKVSAIETFVRTHLARNETDRCEDLLSQLAATCDREPRLLTSHSMRWVKIDRALLLLKQGRPDAAVAWLADGAGRDDGPVDIATDLAMAHALARLDRGPDAARYLLAADVKGAGRAREMQAHYYYAAGVAAAGDNPALSHTLHERASRVWAAQGVVALEREVEDRPPPAARDSTNGGRALPSVINALGSLVDLAHTPRVLGEELVRLLAAIGVTATVRRDEGRIADDVADRPRLPLGAAADGWLTLECETPRRPDLAVLIQDILRIGRASIELERLRATDRQRSALWPEDPIEAQMGALFVSLEMQAVLTLIRRVAATTVPVLITGETGTGKEVVARLLHAYSARAKAPFTAFNCASTPKDILDSQLFGHRRGAFTGAVDHFPGVVRATDKGTLLLDEIGDMPLDVQPKLLRFLESNDIHPVGEAKPTRVDVRVIAATNVKLETLVAQGLFREDLFYRLNIVPLRVPPLRERRADIPAIAQAYLKRYADEYHKGALHLSEEAMEYLLLYAWPGNVRQLANEMRRIAAMAESGAAVTPEHLHPDIAKSRRTVAAAEPTADAHHVVVRADQPLAAAIEQVERAMIRQALDACHGRIEDTAMRLGMSRKGLYLKRQRYELDAPSQG